VAAKNPGSENRKLFVAEIEAVAVGTMRVDSETIELSLSWTVSPARRRSGIGKIKVGNIASIRIAEETGMVLKREENGVLHYWRDEDSS
jgi:hypothetical protein